MTTPKKKTTKELDVRSLARAHTGIAVNTLAGIAKSGISEAARVAASGILLDRGWGKAAQTVENKVDGQLEIIIRKMAGG